MIDVAPLEDSLRGVLNGSCGLGEIESVLTTVFRSRGLTLKFVVATGPATTSGWSSFDEPAQHLLERAKLVGPEVASRELIQLLEENKLRVGRVCAFWGLHPDSPIQLTNDLELTSLQALPSSYARDHFLLNQPGTNSLHHPKPRSALVYTTIVSPLFYQLGTEGPRFDWDDKYLLPDLAALACLVADTPTIWVAEWTQLPPEAAAIGAHGGWSGGFTDINVA